jgi:DNA-binding SARP family transcriptional activator
MQRALLAALLLESGRAVSSDRLVDALWGDAPPPTARAKLHTYVSGLRSAITQADGHSGWILTRAPGYALQAAGMECDLVEFELLASAGRVAAADGDHPGAIQAYSKALALWRGQAFADVGSSVIRAAATGIDEHRVLVIEALAQANLDAGQSEAVVRDLSAAILTYPLRERLRGLMMTAYYRLGCRADALRLYRDGHRVIREELGLEPGPQLRDLHQRILAGDPLAGGAAM